MPLFYKALQSSIESKDGKKKWHPRLVKLKKYVTTQQIGEMIAEMSSLTPGDVHNSIRNLTTVMRDQLMNSRTVKLDGLGTFTVIAVTNGNGVDNPEDVTSSQIKHLKIRFTPEYTRPAGTGTTRAMFANVQYERWGGKECTHFNNDGDKDDEFVDPV